MAITNFVKNIRNIMRNDAGINGDAQRIEQIAWMLFLKVYDEKENDWEFNEDNYTSFIPEQCRWRNWAKDDGTGEAMTADKLLDFVNNTLFPTLKELEVTPDTPMRSAIVRATFQDANQYMKDGVLLRQVINVIDGLDLSSYEESHAFGEIYETILKEMQSAGSAGEFYTPRALTDFMAEIINPQVGERVADFACGTGGFLTSWLKALDKKVNTAEDREAFANSIYGIEKKQFPYMLCVTNMLLHDIDSPKVFHGNSLTKDVLNYTDKDKFNVILMNPPYGGNEKNDVKRHFPSDLASSETADLFMVVIQYRLAKDGRAAVILPDGFLFGADNAKLAIKEKLLREFNLHTIIRLPGSIFSPYTSIATNILFFNNEKAEDAAEGFSTKDTWFYRLDMPEGYKHFSKTKPMLVDHCKPMMDWWNNRVEIIDEETGDEKSRCFSAQELLDLGCNFDQCKFPKEEEEVLRPEELLKQYHEINITLNKAIECIVSNIESTINGGTTNNVNLSIKNPCNRLAELFINFPDRIKKSILQEAIKGCLVPQEPNDEPASVLIAKIRKEKEQLVKEGKLKKKDLELKPISEDEIPFDIPDSWEWARLGDVGLFERGNGIKRDETFKSGYPCVRYGEMYTKYKYVPTFEKTVSFTSKSVYEKCRKAHKGDLFMALTGENKQDISLAAQYIGDEEIAVGGDLCHFTILEAYGLYFVYLINSTYFSSKKELLASGDIIVHISTDKLASIPIPLPPLAEQKRIVTKIEELLKEIGKL